MTENLTKKILISFILGIIVGILFNVINFNFKLDINFVYEIFDFGGTLFLTVLKMLVVPIVFVSIICGICNLNNFSSLGKISLKTISIYLITTSFAITLALIIASVIQPGLAENLNQNPAEIDLQSKPSIKNVFLNIVPNNPFKALSEGNMLQVIFFSLILGASISMSGKNGVFLKNFFTSFNEILLKALEIIMKFAPLGIFCLIAKTFSSQGLDIILELGKYFFTVIICLVIHTIFVYGLFIKFFGKHSPISFFFKIKDAVFFAFSTSSSSATIPITLRSVIDNLKVKEKIASFTVPLGSTINMDGTAIMQGVATVFIANIYGFSLDMNDFISIILTATLASIGTAGVPGVGLIMLGMVLNQIGLPLEGIAIIMGVDRFLDMLRTSTNVCGDAMVSLVVDRTDKK